MHWYLMFRAELFANYTSKIHNVRLIVSLASIRFLNDVGISIQACCSSISKEKRHSTTEHYPRKNLAPFDFSETRGEGESASVLVELSENWAKRVIDKLLDYQRFARRTSQRHSQLAINTVGTWVIKTVLLESIIGDLFVSTTMLRVELSHAHQRVFTSKTHFSSDGGVAPISAAKSKHQTEPKPLDLINLEVRRANLIFSEHRTNQRKISETKQILNCSMRQGLFKFETFGELAAADSSPITNNLLIDLGELEGNQQCLPFRLTLSNLAVSLLHDIVKGKSYIEQLSEQLHHVIVKQPYQFSIDYSIHYPYFSGTHQYSSSVQYLDGLAGNVIHVQNEFSRHKNETGRGSKTLVENALTQQQSAPVDVQFRIQMTSLELIAQLLPSLKTKYKMTKAAASGYVGMTTQYNAEILEHQVCFIVVKANDGESPVDTFILPLPFIKSSGRYRIESTSSLEGPNPRLVYKRGGYHDVIITAGPMEHTFSTDLLNQILFAEQSFRSELTFLLERLSVERPASSLPAAKPILFNLTVTI